jgi:fructose-specific phosphotransferase system IIC component
MKQVLKYALILSAGASILGGMIALMMGNPFLQGAYLFNLGLAVVAMMIASYYLIGTPKKRYDFFFRTLQKPSKDSPKNIDNLAPALLAVWLLFVGFFLESLMH